MGNVFNEFLTRVREDWRDWRAYKVSMRNVRYEGRAIQRALNRAMVKNAKNSRTYYILKDKVGGINEFSRDDIIFWATKHKPALIANMSYMERLNVALAIVTSNKAIQEQYNQIQLNKEATNEKLI